MRTCERWAVWAAVAVALLAVGATAIANGTGQILFVSERDGNAEIYVMESDGSGQTRLTDDPGEDRDPSWSPDGTKLVFASDRDGDFDLYTMNLDGSGLTKIVDTEDDEAWPVWSPDGTMIAFIRGSVDSSWYRNDSIFVLMDDPRLYVMDLATRGETRLGSSIQSLYAPSWSPDGTRLAYHEIRETMLGGGWGSVTLLNLKVIEIATGDTVTVAQSMATTQRVFFYSHPAWSPDGELIALEYAEANRSRPGRITSTVSTIDPGGGNRETVARGDMDNVLTEPSWSPGGAWIAYTNSSMYNLPSDIYVIASDGSGAPTRLTTTGADYAPAWND